MHLVEMHVCVLQLTRSPVFVLICWNFVKTKEPEAQPYKSVQAEPSGDAGNRAGEGQEISFFRRLLIQKNGYRAALAICSGPLARSQAIIF
jgi:hypothetical protein